MKLGGYDKMNAVKKIRHYRELDVYRLAFDAAMVIFEASKKFPAGERFSLSSQIVRSVLFQSLKSSYPPIFCLSPLFVSSDLHIFNLYRLFITS
jgi:hypothetical protein